MKPDISYLELFKSVSQLSTFPMESCSQFSQWRLLIGRSTVFVMSEEIMIDYQQLLIKYIAHVSESEGIDFLDDNWRYISEHFISFEEWKELRMFSLSTRGPNVQRLQGHSTSGDSETSRGDSSPSSSE